jgi:hypothetical protein
MFAILLLSLHIRCEITVQLPCDHYSMASKSMDDEDPAWSGLKIGIFERHLCFCLNAAARQ